MLESREQDRYRRQIAAMLKSAGGDDPEAFAFVVALLDDAVRTGLPAAAQRLQQPTAQAPGYSWRDIAGAMGVSRATAWQRFSGQGSRSKAAQAERAARKAATS